MEVGGKSREFSRRDSRAQSVISNNVRRLIRFDWAAGFARVDVLEGASGTVLRETSNRVEQCGLSRSFFNSGPPPSYRRVEVASRDPWTFQSWRGGR